MQDLNISIIQSDIVWKDVDANLASFSYDIDQIEEEVDLIVLPEMFNTGFVVDPEDVAEKMNGKSLLWMIEQARNSQAVICGSLIIHEKNKYYNRLFWVNPDGSFKQYDKRHLFSLGGEHQKFTGGTESMIVELKGWKIKPLVCYDLRFPVWAKNNYSNGKYDFDLLIYIANWPASRRDPWMSLLKARAIENQAYVIGVNRIGEDGNGLAHSGDSNIYDAKGKKLIKHPINTEYTETLSLSKKTLKDFREKFTVGLDWDRFSIEK
ncbi:MAG: amidohydrolase [Bacteroidales bacterium]|jgi:omega-amidase|nr:amidohydrolase [Bacteroidales bacterium]